MLNNFKYVYKKIWSIYRLDGNYNINKIVTTFPWLIGYNS